MYADDQLKATVAVTDSGAYKPVALRAAQAPRKPKAVGRRGAGGGMSLYQSLYETALKQGLPRSIIDVMTRVFANDVDFQRATAPGDSIEAFFSDPDDINPRPELLCASMTVRDQTFKYYRFQTPDDNMVDFYDENGRSMRKFLVRKPIAEGDMTSPFGMRFHPILHYARMHTGVDWAAPIGTPIYAAGNGVVIKAGWDGGYGRRVEIQHANGYVTAYNHMSGFGRGIVEGAHVVQGQTVGYLGDSGLATGPHLHYEVIINGNFVDPMAIKLPRTREFDGRMLAAFKRERDRIDQLMGEVSLRRGDVGGEARVRIAPRNRGASTELDRKSDARRLSRTPTRRELRPAPSPSRAIRRATRTDGFSTASRRSGRERAGGADSAARQGQAAPAAGGGPRSRRAGRAHARRRSRPEARHRPPPPDGSSPPDRARGGQRRPKPPAPPDAAREWRPRHIRSSRGAPVAASMRAPHVEPERRLVAAGDPVARLGRRQRATSSGIERRAVRVALPVRGARDLRPAAKTGVDEALSVEPRERRRVVVAMLALPRGGAGKRSPSHARSSMIAASNCGLQRVRSKSSMRSSTRPLVSAAMRSFISAE